MAAGGQPRHGDLRRIPGERLDQRLAPALVDAAHLAQVPVVPPRLDRAPRAPAGRARERRGRGAASRRRPRRAARGGQTSQPIRSVGDRVLLVDPIAIDPVGRQPLDRADRLPVVAELGVVVVLDDEPVRRAAAHSTSAWRRSGASTTPVGAWCAGRHDDDPGRRARRAPPRRGRARRPGPAPRAYRTAGRSRRGRPDRGPPRRRGRHALGEQGPQHEVEAVPEPGADERPSSGSATAPRTRRRYAASTSRSCVAPGAVLVAEVVGGRGAPGHAQRPQPVAHREAAQVGDAVLEVHVEPRSGGGRAFGRPDLARRSTRPPSRSPAPTGGTPRTPAGRTCRRRPRARHLATFTSRTILPASSTMQMLVSLTETSSPAKWSMLRFSF